MNAITTEHVTKVFGSLVAVNDVSLEIPTGEVFGLLGPNGAGKTTLIHSIMGLYKLKTGKIKVLGHEIPKEKQAARKKCGFMPQDTAVYTDLTPKQNVLFYGRIFGMKDSEIKKRMDEVFKLLALEEKANKLCRTLSGGQRRRVSLGIALLTEAELLILDEPTVGVDPVLRQEFWQYFRDFANQGRTIVISTHITDEAVRTDRVGLMIQGKMLLVGKPKELLSEHKVQTLEELFLVMNNTKKSG